MSFLLTADNVGATSLFMMFAFYGFLFFIIWFFLIRPQNKEKKRIAAMLADMEVNDCVLTTSGFYGIVIDISDDTIIVEFGNNKNCRIPMDKNAVAKVEKPGQN